MKNPGKLSVQCVNRRGIYLLSTTAAFAAVVLLTAVNPVYAQNSRDRRIDDHFSTRLGDRQQRRNRNDRIVPHNHFRSADGTGNNLRHSEWGAADVNLWRRTPAAYADGVSEPAGPDRSSAREISNAIFAQSSSIPNSRGLTDMVWQWGQFLDHDIDLTETQVPLEPFPIAVPSGDLWFDPGNTGTQSIFLFRSAYNISSGITGPRQQINFITAWVDGSNIYGSNQETTDSLRLFRNGMLRVSGNPLGQLLPVDSDGFFMAGDVRANEQVYLTSMHTLFMREHNRVCRRLLEANPALTDEQAFQHARKRVVATLQVITYEEFLPALLGDDALRPYRGYRDNVFPNIANCFSTAAFRFGHSMLNSELLRLDENGNEIPDGHIALADAFFNPDEIKTHGIEPYLRGLSGQLAQEIDSQVIGDVRNFLFGPPGAGGFDLVSLNIQRGRDHGLPSLDQIRRSYGLSPVRRFSDITLDPFVQAELESVYEDVRDVDPWVAMLCEDHMPGSSVGPTAHRVMRDQFERIRDGDRFWYERVFTGSALNGMRADRLSKVIRRNTSIRSVPADVFRLTGG